MKKDRYVVIEWPECQYFMEDRSSIHLADGHAAYHRFGDSAYFVAEGYFEKVTGRPVPPGEPVFVAVPFPESRDFSDISQFESYPVTDMAGQEKYGPVACFVEESLYLEVCKARALDEPDTVKKECSMNLIDIFLHEARADTVDRSESSGCLKEYYEGANMMQRVAVNETFMMVCGRSYEDLVEMERAAVEKKNTGGTPPAP